MNLSIEKSKIHSGELSVTITGSKSESNRLLLLKALYPQIEIQNVSNSDDTEVMFRALTEDQSVVDVHHAGTAMRFLTAYFAIQEGREVVLTGSKRMKERPIKILVDALRMLGAEITYEANEGFPPIQIKGKKLRGQKVSLKANTSSQYVTALLLIGSKLEKGIELQLEGEITSIPYIKMTLSLLKELGVKTIFEDNLIKVLPKKESINPMTLSVESDWSSASYYYSIVALSEIGTKITLFSYKKHSLQGDAVLVEIYKSFGVETIFGGNTIAIEKVSHSIQELDFNLINSPDIAQTITVTAFGLGKSCNLYGLHTLKIKETDRLVALQTEIEKLGGQIKVTENSLHLEPFPGPFNETSIDTYNDHRMAMAFAPLGLKVTIHINEAEVVSKSYPTFWEDLKSIGFQIS